MKLTLELKQRHAFFWLRAIRNVRIDRCCAKCFIGHPYHEVYEATRYKDNAFLELEVSPEEDVKAYYLCGLSVGFKFHSNSHIAFVPDNTKSIEIENDKIKLRISNARQIHFEDYTPAPEGKYSDEQRACRNWIFANYILDGMPL